MKQFVDIDKLEQVAISRPRRIFNRFKNRINCSKPWNNQEKLSDNLSCSFTEKRGPKGSREIFSMMRQYYKLIEGTGIGYSNMFQLLLIVQLDARRQYFKITRWRCFYKPSHKCVIEKKAYVANDELFWILAWHVSYFHVSQFTASFVCMASEQKGNISYVPMQFVLWVGVVNLPKTVNEDGEWVESLTYQIIGKRIETHTIGPENGQILKRVGRCSPQI